MGLAGNAGSSTPDSKLYSNTPPRLICDGVVTSMANVLISVMRPSRQGQWNDEHMPYFVTGWCCMLGKAWSETITNFDEEKFLLGIVSTIKGIYDKVLAP